MVETAQAAGTRSPGRGSRAAWLGALLCIVPALAMAELLWRATVDAPVFDDYDAIVEFASRSVAVDGLLAQARLLFAQHVEHRPAVLRAVAAASFAALGHLDLRLLQGFGFLGLVLLAGALFASFRPAVPVRERLLPFAPAALLLFQPQFWSAYLWPTCSVPNFFAVAFAAVAFRALSGGRPGGFALAIAAATAAVFSQANGIAALPLGLLALVGSRSRARCWAWVGFSLLLGAAQLASFEPPTDTWSAAANLASPARVAQLAGYVLHFLGAAAGFSQPGLAPIAGAALLASFAWLLLRGAHRRSPALLALLGFLLASAAMNALARVQQGVAAPLLQDRYRFYASAFLAASWLAWSSELAGSRRVRGLLVGGICASLAFSLASHALYRGDLLDFSRRVEAGYERWWMRGDGGLFYPRFAEASRILITSFERGVLRVPPAWFAQHGAAPQEAALPEPGAAVRFGIGALRLGAEGLLVDGWAQVGGGDAFERRVFLALRSPARTLLVPTHAVPNLASGALAEPRRGVAAGFRGLVRRADLPSGEYRIGVLVERPDGAWLSFHDQKLAVPGG